MLVTTTHFGEVEVDENSIIHFEEGLLGFEDVKKFVMLDCTDNGETFKVMQAVEKPYPAFAVINPFEVSSDYEVEIDDLTKENLAIKDSNEIAICSIVTIPDKITRMSANLLAPVVINTTNNKARQMVMQNSTYTTKHYILDEVLSTALPKKAV